VEAVTHSKSLVDAVAAEGVVAPSNQVNVVDRNLAVESEEELAVPEPASAPAVDPAITAGSKILQNKEEVPMEEGVPEIDLDRTTSNTVQPYAQGAIVDSTVQVYAQGVSVDTDGGGTSDLSSMWCAHFESNLLAECVKFEKGQEEGVQLQAALTGFTVDPGVLLYSLKNCALMPNNIEFSLQGKAASEHKEQENMMIGKGGRSADAGGDSEDDHFVTAAVGDVLQITNMVENLIVNECRNNMLDCTPNPQVKKLRKDVAAHMATMFAKKEKVPGKRLAAVDVLLSNSSSSSVVGLNSGSDKSTRRPRQVDRKMQGKKEVLTQTRRQPARGPLVN
jgi:hypothetical protein